MATIAATDIDLKKFEGIASTTFYGYKNIYDENLSYDYNEGKYYYLDENDERVYVAGCYYYYSDTTGDKVYCSDNNGWHYFLDKTDVHYIEGDIQEYIYEHPAVKTSETPVIDTMTFYVTFSATTDQSEIDYDDIDWNYDKTEWQEVTDENDNVIGYELSAEIESNVYKNGRWTFNYPNTWRIKSLYGFHTEESGGGCGCGGGIQIKSADFKQADDLSHTVTTSAAFSGCTKLTKVDFSRSTLNSVTDTGYMFYECNSIGENSIVLNSNTTFASLVYAYGMFDSSAEWESEIYSEKIVGCVLSESLITKMLSLVGNGTFESSAADMQLKFVKNGLRYRITSGTEVSVAKYNPTASAIVIPDTVSESNKTFLVKSIDDIAFSNCGNITSVDIQNSSTNKYITEISRGAFAWCYNLTSAMLANTIEEIGNGAFRNCNLSSVVIPSNVTTIDSNAYNGCNNITSVTINSEYDIEYDSLDLYFTSGNIRYKVMDKDVVYVVSKQTAYSGDVVIPSIVHSGTDFDVTAIDYSTFTGCSLTSITIPSSVLSVRSYAFNNCTISSSINILTDADFTNSYLYFINNSLKYKVLNKNSISVMSNSYTGDIVIPSSVSKGNTFSVVKIEASAFYARSGLTSVVIPDSVKTIDSLAFYNCSGLKSLTIGKTETISSNAFSYTGNIETLSYNNDLMGSLITSIKTKLKNVTVGDSVTMSKETFKGYTQLTTATVYAATVSESAFNGCTALTTVTLGDGVKKIDTNAFRGCSYLTTITVGNGIEEIVGAAFANCSRISYNTYDNAYYIGNGTNQYLVLMKAKNTSITTVDISTGCRILYYGSLGNCSRLTTVNIPQSVKGISANAFYGSNAISKANFASIEALCDINFGDSFANPMRPSGYLYINDTLVTSLTIPSTVTELKDYTFYNCDSITSVTIPATVETVGKHTFKNSSNITSITVNSTADLDKAYLCFTDGNNDMYKVVGTNTAVLTPSNKTYSGDFVLSASVTAGTTFSIIGFDDSMFSGNTTLTSVTMHNGTLRIGEEAFKNCSNVFIINIPDGVSDIGKHAFDNILIINYNGEPPVDTGTYGKFWGALYMNPYVENLMYYETSGKLNLIYNTNPSLTSFVIPNTVTTVGKYAFRGCTGLTTITIPSSVTTLDADTFKNCNSLTSVTIDNDLNYSTKNLYLTKDGVKYQIITKNTAVIHSHPNTSGSVIIGSFTAGGSYSVTAISSSAFENCTNITSVSIPNTVTTIGNSAFKGCTGLTAINIPDTVTALGISAFEGCTSAASVYISSGVTSFQQYTFKDCTGVLTVTTNNAKTFAISNLYMKKDGINYWVRSKDEVWVAADTYTGSVTIPSSVTSGNTFDVIAIAESAFKDCSGLTSVSIPSSVTSIGSNAFQNCTGLTTLPIPSSVSSISSNTFKGCTGLTTLTIPSTVTTISSSAFENCTGLTSITVPSNVTSIGSNAFKGCTNVTDYECNNNAGFTALVEKANLERLIINDGVTTIAAGALSGCSSLEYIRIPFIGDNDGKPFGYIFGTTSYDNSYRADQYYNDVELVISYIPNTLKTVVLSTTNNITSIPMGAFENCYTLRSVNIPSTVTSIGKLSFMYCRRVILDVPNTVTSIGSVAFYDVYYVSYSGSAYDENFWNASHHNGTVDANGFVYSDSATTLYCYIGSNTEITIPSSFTNIASNAFMYSPAKKVTTGNNMTSIDSYAFNYSDIEKITIRNNITSIDNYAFINCAKLNDVTFLGSGLTTIGNNAFQNCDSLVSISVPSGVATIDNYAFRSCDSLETITIENASATIAAYVFTDCENLLTIYYNGDTTNAPWGAPNPNVRVLPI